MHLLPPVIQDGNATSMEIPSSGKMLQNMAKKWQNHLNIVLFENRVPSKNMFFGLS